MRSRPPRIGAGALAAALMQTMFESLACRMIGEESRLCWGRPPFLPTLCLSSEGSQPQLRGGGDERVEIVWADDGDADDGVGDCPHADIYKGFQFFRVLHTHPHAWKTVPMSAVVGGKTSANHIAAAPLDVSGATADGPLLVSSVSTSGIYMLGDFTSADMLVLRASSKSVLLWGADGGVSLRHSFRDLGKLGLQASHSDVSDILQQLLSRQALPGRPEVWTVSEQHASTQTLNKLQLHGYVLGQGDGGAGPCDWRLTHKALQSLTSISEFSRPPAYLASPRLDAPLEDRTHYELLAQLLSDGWTWSRLPSGRIDFKRAY
jgi:hypothetical protein